MSDGRAQELDHMATVNIPVCEREIMTLAEAAEFLRFSESTMYQRHDIPRHRVPGSTAIRYLRSELLGWLKGDYVAPPMTETALPVEAQTQVIIDNSRKPLYHRNARYR